MLVLPLEGDQDYRQAAKFTKWPAALEMRQVANHNRLAGISGALNQSATVTWSRGGYPDVSPPPAGILSQLYYGARPSDSKGDNPDTDHHTLLDCPISVTGPILTHLAQASTTDPISPSVIVHGKHRIHVLPRDGLVFLAIAHDKVGVELMQKMLGELADRFIDEYGVGYEMPSIMIPLSMNAFSKQLSVVMKQYSERSMMHTESPIEQSKEDLERVRKTLSVNIEKLLARGEKLEGLDERMEQVNQTALEFERRSSSLRRRISHKTRGLLVGTVVFTALLIFLSAGLLNDSP